MWTDPICVQAAIDALKEILLDFSGEVSNEELMLLTMLDDPVQEWSAYYGESASINESKVDAGMIRELARSEMTQRSQIPVASS
jgi:hypothetical protein